MPNTTSAFTKLSAGDPLIAVLGRIQKHPLQGYALGHLDLGTLGNRDPRRVQALGQLVPDALKLAQGEHPRVVSAR